MSFFLTLFSLVAILFYKAFGIHFFQDDYFFVNLSQARNLKEFLHFFSPIRTYSYKPLPTEVFYFLLKFVNYNVYVGHIVVFLTYFLGLYFLYQCIKLLTKNSALAKLTVFLYAINFVHVFQLYWFATFQEIVVFAGLAASFYFYLRREIPLSIILFIVALLSKETAILYIIFLVFFEIFSKHSRKIRNNKTVLIIFGVISLIFYFIYHYSLNYVTANPNNQIVVSNVRLLLNNSMWYLLWAIGLPNFVPNFLKSIFSPPLPIFHEYWKQLDFRIYSYLFILLQTVFLTGAVIAIIKRNVSLKSLFKWGFFCLIAFYIFLGPILYFYHKWMIRLTVPLIFTSLFFAYVIYKLIKSKSAARYFAVGYLALYLLVCFFGIRLHESSSLYLLEDSISKKASVYFKENKQEILKYNSIFFRDLTLKRGEIWGQSIKLKDSLWDQQFLNYYFPGKKLKAYYNFETKTIPKDAFIIDSYLLLK